MFVPAREIRERFLRYFESRGHRIVQSGSVVPDSDPTLMFVNAGMVPFKRTFLGEERRPYTRATSSQKCIRVSGKHNDLEMVGRSQRHHTFFEMLGNFSFGDYFKEGAIDFAWELLTGEFAIDPGRLAVSVFREDDEAARHWETAIGVPQDKIYHLDEEENFWSMGDTGPCGPCSEIHIDYGRPDSCTAEICDPSCECGRWLEIWNLVFMQFDQDASGNRTPLPKPCVDTGGGLERWACVLQDVRGNYDTDLFRLPLGRAQEISGKHLGEDSETDVSLKVLADHARSLTFLIGDGVLPSNAGRGYVVRRILRRASRHALILGVEEPCLHEVVDAVIDEMAPAFPEVGERRDYIRSRVSRDEERFLETLSRGLQMLEDEIQERSAQGETVLPGASVFKLYDTFGFPLDLTADVLRGRGMSVDQDGFDSAMSAQKSRARAAWKGSGDEAVGEVYQRMANDLATSFCGYQSLEAESPVTGLLVGGEPADSAGQGDGVEIVVEETPFYAESGGQVGDVGTISNASLRIDVEDTLKPVEGLVVHRGKVVEGTVSLGDLVQLAVDASARQATVRNHSGTHLLHAALREVLGSQAAQKGSLVGPDRLRFDFTHDSPLTPGEIERIEDLANEWIEANARAQTRETSYDEAVKSGAIAIFEEKYGDDVRVVSFGPFSTELCGGTHAGATGDIGLLKITSEQGIASGVRRIEALTGLGALRHIRKQERALDEVADLLKTAPAEVPSRIGKLLEERRVLQRELDQLKRAQAGEAAGDLMEQVREINGTKVLGVRVDGIDAEAMRSMVDDFRNRLGSGVVLVASSLASEGGSPVLLAVGVTKDLVGSYKAGALIRDVAKVVGGGGGGRPDFAQAGGKDASKIDEALERFYALVAG
jgi:alanyl-tRNA synthetase